MCNKCSQKRTISGMGNAQPLQKVETYNAPVVLAPTQPIATTGQQGRVYVPTVTASQNVWGQIGGTVNGILEFITATKSNNLAQQQQFTNDPTQYAFAQQPAQVQYAQPLNNANTGIQPATIVKGVLVATAVVGGILLLKK